MKREIARKLFGLMWLIMFFLIAIAGVASIDRVDYSAIDPDLMAWAGGLALLLFAWSGALFTLCWLEEK